MIAILTSGVALGVHVPGLLLASRLREQGAEVMVNVLERLLPEDRRDAVAASRTLFHRDFRTARAGQRLASDPARSVPAGALAELEQRWTDQNVRTLVVFSGFWLSIADNFARRSARPPRVVICHVDSAVSPSFRRAGPLPPGTEQIWLASAADQALPWTVPVDPRPPVPWAERDERLLVHGGGWGMGTYRDRAVTLESAGHALDLVVHEAAEAQGGGPRSRYFMIDPAWHPWLDDGYPPLGRILPGQDMSTVRYSRGTTHHTSYDLARHARAMVSKPGGGTLLDSLWSATPLVLLEPSGEHEARNAELWTGLGFAVRYEDWRAEKFGPGLLEPLHRALIGAAARPRDLAAALAHTPEGALCSG